MIQILFDTIWTGINIRLFITVLAFIIWTLRYIYRKKIGINKSIR